LSPTHKHIIQRQVFELQVASSTGHFKWQQQSDQYLQEIINPAIASCFNDNDPVNQHLVIDKLEIDLGCFSEKSFATEAKDRLLQLLGEKLRALSSTPGWKTTTVTGSADPDKKQYNNNEVPPILMSHAKATQMALQHFLLHGCFPWWYQKPAGASFTEALVNQAMIDALHEPDKALLQQTLLTVKEARTRLVNHFDTAWIAALLQHIDLYGNDGWQQWKILVPVIKEFHGLQTLFHQHFWMEWIMAAGERKKWPDMAQVVIQTGRGNKQLMVALAQTIQKKYVAAMHGQAVDEQLFARFVVESMEKFMDDRSGYASMEAASACMPSAHTIDEKPQTIEKVLTELSGKPNRKKGSKEEAEGMFISAAGLVILHPFLTELFSTAGLWTNNGWASETAAFRAVRLLSYLSYGNTDAPEPDLVFHKILVGMEATIAIPADIPLTDAEIASCEELLQAVITHWQALRNTSADGLREGFLQRAGKLMPDDKGYLVQVERKAQDVLLAHLPWGYGIIKLPWLDSMLHVSWI
jgi:hypothetical protein